MRKILVIISILASALIELQAQIVVDDLKSSLELSFGVGQVGFFGENDFVIDRITCDDCDYDVIRKEGLETNFSLSFNRYIFSKSELYFGFGLNVWAYNVDRISGWTGEALDSETRMIGLLDFLVGYRYFLKKIQRNSIFIENVVHNELNTSDKFRQFRLSVEPGIGVRIKLGDKFKLLTVLKYKQSLTNFSGVDHTQQKLYSFGIRCGINISL